MDGWSNASLTLCLSDFFFFPMKFLVLVLIMVLWTISNKKNNKKFTSPYIKIHINKATKHMVKRDNCFPITAYLLSLLMQDWKWVEIQPFNSPSFSFCSSFMCLGEITCKAEGLASCLGVSKYESSVRGSEALGRHVPSTANGRWPSGEETAKPEVWLSTGTTFTFCCPWEKATRDCMALLKVSWCWTSWRTHLERPEIKHTNIRERHYQKICGWLLPSSVQDESLWSLTV